MDRGWLPGVWGEKALCSLACSLCTALTLTFACNAADRTNAKPPTAASSGPSSAAAARDDRPPTTEHVAENELPFPQDRVPDAVVVRSVVRPSDPKREDRNWEVRRWDARPQTWFALTTAAAKDGTLLVDLDTWVSVVEHRDGKLRRIATGRLALSDAGCDTHADQEAPGPPPRLAFDPVLYPIAEGETAIGVRLSCEFSFPAGEGDETRLYLLRTVDGAMVNVLSVQMAFNDYQRGPNDETHGTAVLIIEHTQHEGLFDLLLKETIASTPLIAEHKRTKNKSVLHHFQFQSGSYREVRR